MNADARRPSGAAMVAQHIHISIEIGNENQQQNTAISEPPARAKLARFQRQYLSENDLLVDKVGT